MTEEAFHHNNCVAGESTKTRKCLRSVFKDCTWWKWNKIVEIIILCSSMFVLNAPCGDLGFSVCLVELPVSLAQLVIWERAVKVSCTFARLE